MAVEGKAEKGSQQKKEEGSPRRARDVIPQVQVPVRGARVPDTG